MHKNLVEFSVTGDYALFSDPVTGTGGEKSTCPVPTYEALKGILSSVYWKPTIIWYIDAVRIMNEIRTEPKGIKITRYDNNKNDRFYYTFLKDCHYQVRAHFEWNENRPEMANDRDENKHHQSALRMIRRGGRRDVFLGSRKCQGYVAPVTFGSGSGYYDNTERMQLGLMYHGITYADEAYSEATCGMMSVRLWYPVMERGVIHFLRPQECPVHKSIRKMKVKAF